MKSKKIFTYSQLSNALSNILYANCNEPVTKQHKKMGTSNESLSSNLIVKMVGASAILLSSGSYAAISVWGGESDDLWGNNSNWSSLVAPNAAGDQILFLDSDPNFNGSSISLGSSIFTIGTMTIASMDNTSFESFSIVDGTLNLDNLGRLSAISLTDNRSATISSNITTANDLIFSNGSAYAGKLTLSGEINGGGHEVTFENIVNSSIIANGVISNTSSVVKDGLGILELNNANTFNKNFTFNAGTIGVGNDKAFGSSQILMAKSGNQTFDVSSGSRTLANQITLSDGFSVTGVGNSLKLNASETQVLQQNLGLNVGNGTTLDFGSGFNLSGAAGVNKNGFGSLILESKKNDFSGGLIVNQGAVNTGSFTDTLTIGSTAGTNHMLGTGDITLSDSSSNININSTSSGNIDFAGSSVRLSNGAAINVLNGASTTLSGGTIDFGNTATKGRLNIAGNLTLGNTSLVNASGVVLTVVKDLTFLSGSAAAQSGIDLMLNSGSAQKISGQGVLSGMGNLTKTGKGTATVQSGLAGLGVLSLSVLQGTLDLGNALITTNSVNLGGGTMALHQANQISADAMLNLTQDTDSTLNLNGFDQTLAGVNSANNSALTFNLGGTSSTSNSLFLGTLSGAAKALRISNWDGTLDSSFDHIKVAGTLSAEQLGSIWFKGFTQGAIQVGDDLRPFEYMSATWNGLAGDNLWDTGANWVGGDSYNVPDHAGTQVFFDNPASNPMKSASISLAGNTRTLGSLEVTNAAPTFSNGTLIFDSGSIDKQSSITVNALNNPWASFNTNVQLNSDTLVNPVSKNSYAYFGSTLSGPGRLIIQGDGTTQITATTTNLSGGVTLNSGSLVTVGTIGSGDLLINGGSIESNFTANAVVNNKLAIGGDFEATSIDFTQAGDINLANANTTIQTSRAVSFGADANLTGTGSLTQTSSGSARTSLSLLSADNTFSGGLFVLNNGSSGGPTTSLRSTLDIGQLDPGHNYLGSGNITVTGTSHSIDVKSNGFDGALNGSALNLYTGGIFNYLGGGLFTLAGGVLDGGATGKSGLLNVEGDLSFGATTLAYRPDISVNTNGTSTLRSTNGGNVSGLGHFSTSGTGRVILDSSITNFAAIDVSITQGILQFGADNQVSSTTNFILSGSALDSTDYGQQVGTLSLLDSAAILVGNNGGMTFSSARNSASYWIDGKRLTLENDGSDWNQPGASYVRFISNPNFTASQFANIAFTGYENGSHVSVDLYPGYFSLLPTGAATTEWDGSESNSKWSTVGNWLTGITPNGVGQSATIRDIDTALTGKTIDVDADYTLGHLNLDAVYGQRFTLGGTGSLTFNQGASDAAQLNHTGNSVATIAANSHLVSNLQYNDSVNNTSGYLNWSGNVDGSGGMTKTGVGTLRISSVGDNTYSGGFLWKDSSLIQINADGALFGSAGLTVGDGTNKNYTLQNIGQGHTVSNPLIINGNLALQNATDLGITSASSTGGALTFTGDTTLTNGMHTISTSGSSMFNLNGDISGTGGLSVTGSNLVINGANNTFSGGVTLNGSSSTSGRVTVSQDQGLGTGIITIYGNTTGNRINSTAADTLDLSNELNFSGGFSATGLINFDHHGTSNVSNRNDISLYDGTVITFGKDHILTGTGGFNFGRNSAYTNSGSIQLLGQNTFTGGVNFSSGYLYLGASSTLDESGKLISGPVGTGAFAFNGGTLYSWSDVGSGITTRRLSNQIQLTDKTTVNVSDEGDANTLVWDAKTLALPDLGINVRKNVKLSIESQITDSASAATNRITLGGTGTLELKNGSNQISEGVIVNSTDATLLATAAGDVTTGVADEGHNYLGTGPLTVSSGTIKIATGNGSTVRLSGNGIAMNNAGKLIIDAGADTDTVFDTNSYFTGTNTSGSITTSGRLIKEGAGTTTQVGAKLITPDLVISHESILSLTNANLVSGVGTLNMNGGTLAVNGLSQTFSPSTQLILGADSHIDFGTGSAIVTVGSLGMSADGKSVGSSDFTLNLDNWDGNVVSGSGNDRFIVTNGLADGQKIQNIWFTGGYAPGAKVLINQTGLNELVPSGVAYIWDNHSSNAMWTSSNWNNPGAPTISGSAAVFSDIDSNLNGRTISMGSGATLGALSFESTQNQAFTIADGTLTFDSAVENGSSLIRVLHNSAPIIASAVNLISNLNINELEASSSLTFSGAISGANTGITKTGIGTLALTSDKSIFTNGLDVSGGLLQIGASSVVDNTNRILRGPAGIGELTLNEGAAIQAINGEQTLHNGLTLNGDLIVLGDNALTLAGGFGTTGKLTQASTLDIQNAAGSLTFGNNLPLVGVTDLTKVGAGTLNFNSDGSGFSGNVIAQRGTVGVGVNNGLGVGTLALNNGSTLAANVNGLTLANQIMLGAGAQTISTGNHDLALNSNISGQGGFVKTGSGALTLNAASSYNGNTSVQAGTLNLNDAGAASSGKIDVAAAAAMNTNFSNATLSNALSGAGTVNITGTHVNVAADNSAFSGVLAVADNASAEVINSVNLGNASIALNGNGLLTLAPDDADFMFNNVLTGTGVLSVALGGGDKHLTFGTHTGSAFTGTAAISSGIASLDANSSSALANATLKLDAGGKAQTTGDSSVGNMTFNGGTLLTNMDVATGALDGKIATNTLTLNSGNVLLDLAPLNTSAGILRADDGVNAQLVAANSLAGDIKNLQMVDASGDVLGATSTQNITQGGNVVAKGTYSESLSSTGAGGSGIYISYQLDQVDLQAGETLSLNEGSATSAAAELKAKVAGTGNLDIAATKAITISNTNNSYSGSTTVTSGTAKAGAANVFASSGAVDVKQSAVLDMNLNAQLLNNLTGAGSVLVSAALTVNNTADTIFSGLLNGNGGLTKTGNSQLALSGVNTLSGATQINAGSIKALNNKSLGNSVVTVASGANLELAFSDLDFANTLAGQGTVSVSGSQVAITGTNTLDGKWDITGSASAHSAANLGAAGVNLNGTASLLDYSAVTGNATFGNALTGTGTLMTSLTDTKNTFDFASTAGNAFAGTFDMKQGTFMLSGGNTAALTHAVLKADAGSVINVGAGNQQIGGLNLAGGKIIFDATIPAQTQANGIVTAQSLNINDSGTVQISTPDVKNAHPALPTETNLLSQDDSGAITKLAAAGSIIGAGGAVTLVDQNGQVISDNEQIGVFNGATKVAIGTYDYRLNTSDNNDGLYVSYALKGLELLDGQTLTFTPTAGSTGIATDMSATITGGGNLNITAGAGNTVSLTNSSNNYTGATSVTSGLLKLGSDNALGNTTNLSLAQNGLADINGYTQTAGSFTGALGSMLNLSGGTLALTKGGSSAGKLTGAGTLALNGSDFAVTDANKDLTANVTIASGASATLNNVSGLGDTGTINTSGDLILNGATGTLSKTVAGAGTVNLSSGSKVILSGNNTLAGSWNIATDNTLTASAAQNLGSAAINNSGQFNVGSSTDWALGNALTGSGLLTKNGTGNLTIDRANNRSGKTAIMAGQLTLTNTDALGSGSVNVDSNAADTAQGLNLAFDTAQRFVNDLAGSGITSVTGAGIATIAGANAGYTGKWNISGKAAVDSLAQNSNTNLGTGGVDLTAKGSLDIITADAFVFNNALTGQGVLNISDSGKAFSFGIGTGSAWAGTAALSNSTFDLSGDNTTALKNATLSIGKNNVTTVGEGIQHVGNVTLAGGTIDFSSTTIPADDSATGSISTGTLAVTGESQVVINATSATQIINPNPSGSMSILEQDDDIQIKLIDAAAIAAGSSAGNLVMVDENGNLITDSSTTDVIEHGSRVAQATFDYTLTFGDNNDGLYAGYGLKQLDIQAGEQLTLTPDAGATGAASDLSAKVTGSGSLAINAGAGQTVSLSNSTNNYLGETVVQSGTLKLAADNVLGNTTHLAIDGGATVDMNNQSQSVGALSAYSGSVLNLDGTLTINDSLRADAADTAGGRIDKNTLFGGGTLVIDPSVVNMNGSQMGFTGQIDVNNGSQLMLNSADALDNARGISLLTERDRVTFADISGVDSTWTSALNGVAKVGFSGMGNVELRDGSDITVTGDSSAFSGTFDVASGTYLRASEAKNVGSADIQLEGNFVANNNLDWTFQNAITGNGEFEKTGGGTLLTDSAFSNFKGKTTVSEGVLILGDRSTTGSTMAGDLAIGANGTFSGMGNVNGSVVNQGRIVSYNVLPGINGAGDNEVSNLTVGPLTNPGLIQLAGAEVGNTLTVTGGLTGAGGTIVLNTELGNDSSVTDKLILDGGQTTGTTSLIINNQGGVGAKTDQGILVIDAVNGATTESGSFALSSASTGFRSTTGTLAAGAYDYSLVRGGNNGNAESWYLSSGAAGDTGGDAENLRPEPGVYAANMLAAQNMFQMTLHDREAYTRAMGEKGTESEHSSWARVTGNHSASHMADGTLSNGFDMVSTQMGVDLLSRPNTQYGSLYAGVMGGWGNAKTSSENRYSHKKSGGSVNGYSMGVYSTWYEQDKGLGGAYVDSWAQHDWFNNEVHGDGLRGESYGAQSDTMSLETGYAFKLSDSDTTKVFLEPQGQVEYSSYRADHHTEAGGTKVRLEGGNGLTSRAGARLYSVHSLKSGQTVKPYVEVNYWYTQNTGHVVMDNDDIANGSPKSYGEMKAGVVSEVSRNLQVSAQVGGQAGDSHFSSVQGQVGIKYSW
ncbi:MULTISPECIES: autotransporter outer membrane beta-barrel domain-containing protein [Rahnella]|uniref:Autotransporter outer membrane beta-barrel domain-containing protein n=1 Tax=Rahnella laticis TaxID=2787622 RepID=A0ABS0DZT4_9GAMM|nr:MULTISPECIES: autotransporter outer membrane beta-barrel domain-containing protein [Rahnella]MBF7978368.1 autotransporter outer membrane beta-barrel domain-containing protein [Rahnella laticis]MBF7997915.1 autotransporter outer membrane beta-barrel domain-containing protein [Rahnella sp. LAC-M12]